MWSDVFRIYCWDDDDNVAVAFRIATVTSHNADNVHTVGFGFVNGRDKIWADIAFAIAPSHRQDKQHVTRSRIGNFQPVGKDVVPAAVVGSGGQFGDVIHGSGRINTRQLPKVVDGVTA